MNSQSEFLEDVEIDTFSYFLEREYNFLNHNADDNELDITDDDDVNHLYWDTFCNLFICQNSRLKRIFIEIWAFYELTSLILNDFNQKMKKL